MAEPRTRGAFAPTNSEDRAILCRGAYDVWVKQCHDSRRVPPYGLPAALAPVPTARVREVLNAHDDPNLYRLRQAAASLCAQAGHDVKLVVGPGMIEPKHETPPCPCCVAYRMYEPREHYWTLQHKHASGTGAEFDPDTEVTTVRSTFLVQGPSRQTPTPEQIRALLNEFAEQFDPQLWRKHGPESFNQSEAYKTKPNCDAAIHRHFPQGDQSWSGQLLEGFAWSWNAESTMAMENVLNIDYFVGEPSDHDLRYPEPDKRVIDLRYSLARSLTSKLWLSRQAGGLDIDRGECTVMLQGFAERKANGHPDQQLGEIGLPEYVDSDRYNICIRATKTVRFTPLEEGPDWLSTLLNYLSPVMAQIWLTRAVHTGVWKAIHQAEADDSTSPSLPPPDALDEKRRSPWP